MSWAEQELRINYLCESRRTSLLRKPTHRWEENIKMDVRVQGYEDVNSNGLAPGRVE